jgi:phospholipase C
MQPKASSRRRFKPRLRTGAGGLLLLIGAALLLVPSAAQVVIAGGRVGTVPIQHVVILFQENHSFDDVFGRFCVDVAAGHIIRPGLNMACDGAVTGKTARGKTIPLAPAPDYVPSAPHSIAAQQTAIDGGLMDGFSLLKGCRKKNGYGCYQTFDPSSIPNLSSLAEHFALSDRTFELSSTPSWGGHLVMAAATTDGFSGDNPQNSTFTRKRGPGWGCDSYRDAQWWNGSAYVLEPACIPDQAGNGPYRSSPASYVPTIFDRLETAGLSWKIYGAGPSGSTDAIPYGWDICPSFYECLGSSQRANLVPTSDVISDASAGTLPNFAIVTPSLTISQHNNYSMAQGDNWIGGVVSAIENGPDWSSSAVFIVYDDCGCFYDHVNPLQYDPNWGIRVPVTIVSPYARAGYTDSTPATLASFLAYTEQVYSLPSLGAEDVGAYGFASSFDYSQQPLRPVKLTHTLISHRERLRISRQPPPVDDPT